MPTNLNCASVVVVADEPDTFARHAEADFHFRANGNELDEASQGLRQKVAAFMTAVETHLFAKQARRDADSDRRIAGIQPLRRYYALHCSMYARLANLRDVLAKDM